MSGSKLLEYLGLRRASGTGPTTEDRVFTAVAVVVVVATLSLTRNLDFWPQIAVLAAASIVVGVVSATLKTIAARRRRHNPDE